MNFDSEAVSNFQLWKNGRGNLESLPPNLNLKKSAEGFIEWSDKQNDNYKTAFLIPDMKDYILYNFADFMTKREALIAEKLS